MEKLTGSCLCGTVKYQVTNLNPKMGHCHCSMCRKFHGAAFATFGEVASEDFRWLTGESALKVFIADNGTARKFCSQCGASLIFKSKNDQATTVEFTLGTLDSDINQYPDSHIFVGSKANWFEISDDLPQFNQGRD